MASHAIYMCRACGHLYDQAAGEPDQGIAPGTDIDELSADWRCPEYGANKNALERII